MFTFMLCGLVLLSGIVLVAAGLGPSSPFRPDADTASNIQPYVATTGSPVVQGDPQGQPVRVVVQNANRTLVNTGMVSTLPNSKGVLGPPPGRAGWYALKGWPKPGFKGAAIVVGHVSVEGKADVFIDLDQVRKGDTVLVTYSSGDQVSFTVTRSKVMKKSEVGRDGTIWAPTGATRSLRLITCDRATETSQHRFPNNYVVWAEQTKPAKPADPATKVA